MSIVNSGVFVRQAIDQDIPAWLDLAAEVEPLFGPLVNDQFFLRALRRNVDRGSAFCVRRGDGPPGSPLAGGLLWSAHPPRYVIGWLAVAAAARRHGVGCALVDHVLSLVVPPAEVSLTTFDDDVPEGEPAREFYMRLGFHPSEPAPVGPEGGSRRIWRRQVEGASYMLGDGSHAG
jgi:ribosomal protein S18 acetylase RimI-like enzyme